MVLDVNLKRKISNSALITIFDAVIQACAKVPRSDGGTWITPKIIETYRELHRLGYAMSFEALDREGKLVGGLYGMRIGRYFSGESMFYKESGASKFALIKTVEYLREVYGCSGLDAQVNNHFTETFGAYEISRETFMKLHIRN